MDYLHIKGLKALANIGVFNWEQQIKQPLFIDLSLKLSLADCNDNLQKTLDYAELSQKTLGFVETHAFQLIETLAEKLAFFLKENYHLAEITVGISKPTALKAATNVQVVVTR